MEEFTHKVQLEDFLGLDLTSNDLKRPDNFLTGGSNFDIDDNGDLVTRRGVAQLLENMPRFPDKAANFFGLDNTPEITSGVNYIVDGTPKRETVFLSGTSVDVVSEQSISVTNTSGALRRVSVFYDSLAVTYKISVFNNSNTLLGTINLPAVASAIKTFLDTTVGGFTVTISGGSSYTISLHAGDFIIGSGNTRVFKYYAYSTVTAGYTSYSGFSFSPKTSTALLNNSLYMTGNNGQILKYDGQTFYKAGLPKIKISSLANVNPTAIEVTNSTDTFTYKIRLAHRDNAGNYIYGPFSEEKSILVTAGKAVAITVDYDSFVGLGTGYKSRYATATSAPSGLTTGTAFSFTTSGNTLKVGDLVFWPKHGYTTFSSQTSFNNIEEYWKHFGRVTAVGPGLTPTITVVPEFSSQDPHVKSMSSDVVSAGMWLEVYRTKRKSVDPGQTSFYLIGTPAVNNDAIKVYDDNWYDQSVGTPLEANPQAPNLLSDVGAMAPACQYLTTYNSRLIATGDIVDGNIVHFSESGFPENFPTSTNSFLTDTEFGDGAVGCSGNQDSLIVFKSSTIHRVIGDLGGLFTVERIFTGSSCFSHNGISEIGEQRTIFPTKKGLYQIIRSSSVRPLMPIEGITGESIDRLAKYFSSEKDGDYIKYFSYINTNTYPNENKAIITVPKRYDDATSITSASNFELFDYIVFDYKKGLYTIWQGLNSYGGFIVSGEDLIFVRTNGALSTISMSGLSSDYLDHTTPITTELKFNWMHLGRPDVLKKFLRGNIWILGNDGSSLTAETEINWDSTTTSTLALMPYETTDTNIKFKMTEQRAKALRLIISHSEPLKRLRLPGFTLEVVAPFKPRLKE